MIDQLIKLADRLDKRGYEKEASYLDEIILDISKTLNEKSETSDKNEE
tara:strand:- start:113 stop:256 length:144 start_codon:yes stop_codon:yes gene_type:complete